MTYSPRCSAPACSRRWAPTTSHVAVAILDHPNERSLHVRPTPRTGGLALLSGWFVPVGPGLNRRTLVYDKDVAAAAILAVEHSAAGGRVYNVTDGHVHRFCEII